MEDRMAAGATIASTTKPPGVGLLLREWRQRRRLSQLDLACEAAISQRHLSYVESGRARPSREMLLHLAERLDIPLRERNTLLVAGGYAPVFPERRLDDPALGAARQAMQTVLRAHEPNPALAVDRHWCLVAANAVIPALIGEIAEPALLTPPANMLRLTLHPGGLAPRIANLPEWRAHILERLHRQVEASADPTLIDLLEELRGYRLPGGMGAPPPRLDPAGAFVLPFRLRAADGTELSLLGTTTVFGTAVDITLAELTLEAFYPADPGTAEALRRLAAAI
jgi:transcriptional regulator with XRE-family HTH domain